MNSIDRNDIISYKNRIMEGQSISSLARELGIDRKSLKNKILEILPDDEKEKFEEKLNSNFRKNQKSIRRIKKEEREEKYQEAVKKLIELGITSEDIETIFSAISINKHTTMAKDTFAIKLVELLKFIEKRNKDIEPNSKGYITKKELINMILNDSRFMTNDIKRKIEPMCNILDNWSTNINKSQINEYIKQHTMIFKNSIEKLKIHLIIGDNFLIKSGNKYITLSEYMITENPFLLAENSQRFLEGICNLRDSHSAGIIDAKELGKRIEPIHISDEKYILPKYEDDESFKKAVKDVINGMDRKSNNKKGEEK